MVTTKSSSRRVNAAARRPRERSHMGRPLRGPILPVHVRENTIRPRASVLRGRSIRYYTNVAPRLSSRKSLGADGTYRSYETYESHLNSSPRHHCFGQIRVRVHILHVIVIVQRFHEPRDLPTRFLVHVHPRLGDLTDLGVGDGH